MLLPTWSIIHSRHWKLQVPDLARRCRVVTFDGRGNGRSDRPAGVEAYRPAAFTADALAVMDATATDRAVLVALSAGTMWALELGALHADRVAGIVFVGPALPLLPPDQRRGTHSFTGAMLAELAGGSLVTLSGSGHAPHARDPVRFNLLLREFVDSLAPPARPRQRSWTHALGRHRRALYISSPIGLGHARRDVAIARELRALRPELEIDWLAQDPVTQVLDAEGERIHPASALLASESAHVEAESAEHDLRAFQAIRRMDEILLSNFMVFHDAVTEGHYDLVVGDEAWDVDRLLHENPELKRSAFVWMTDFVGWLPMPEDGQREADLTADHNAEMIEHIARFPRMRDQAIFVGNPDDVVGDRPPRAGGAGLRPRPVPAPGSLRPGRRPGRPRHLHGAGRQPAAVPVLHRRAAVRPPARGRP